MRRLRSGFSDQKNPWKIHRFNHQVGNPKMIFGFKGRILSTGFKEVDFWGSPWWWNQSHLALLEATEVLHQPPAALVPQRRDGPLGLHFYSLGGCSLQELGSQLYGYRPRWKMASPKSTKLSHLRCSYARENRGVFRGPDAVTFMVMQAKMGKRRWMARPC